MKQSHKSKTHQAQGNPVVEFMLGGVHKKLLNIIKEFELDEEVELGLDQVRSSIDNLKKLRLPEDFRGEYVFVDEVIGTVGQALLKVLEVKGLATLSITGGSSGFSDELQKVEQNLYLTISSLHVRRSSMKQVIGAVEHSG